MRRVSLAILASVALIGSLIVAVGPAPSADAANGALFNPGNIISDAMMYDGAALSADQVQAFLVQREPSCSSTCMANLRQSTPSMPANRCTPYAGSPSERASDIIAKVGMACGISQKSLIVLIEKESSLISANNPSPSRFNYATGFNCPDTAPCNPAFGSFFYQVYYAARQLLAYAQTPTQWNYQAGRVNQILFSPNASCGTSPVFIQNKATAGLYIYTPYQPNTAALANLYGTGDGCSAYGNRNFWRIFTDWFGPPTAGTSLLRSTDNATVFLVSDTVKYPVPSLPLLSALAPLGQVAFVSPTLLDTFTTGHTVGRSLRGPDGSIYFYDSGIKLPFTSCAQAADYGASCEVSGYVQLTSLQISAFVTGPTLSSVMGTVEGGRYYIKNGLKAEILDDQSQALAGIPAGMNVLTDNALAGLALTAPIVRDGAFATTRGTPTYSLLTAQSRYSIADGAQSSLGVAQRTSGSLLSASMQSIPALPTVFKGVVKVSGTGATSVLSSDGRYDLTGGGLASASSVIPVPQSLVDSYSLLGTIAAGSFVKSANSATVYVVMPTDIRPVSGWEALLALTPSGSPTITTLDASTVDLFARGPVALTSGSLVRSPQNATVYLVNGVTNRVAFSSFDFALAAGFTSFSFATEERIQAYPLASQLLGYGLTCGTSAYIAGGGAAHLVSADLAPLYAFAYVPLDGFTCAQLKVGSPATSFIRIDNGTIFKLSGGQKLPVLSMGRFAEISSGATWTNVPGSFAGLYPTGPAA